MSTDAHDAPITDVQVARIEPERLIALLLSENWQVVGQREGLYTRLRPVDNRGLQRSIVVPLSRSANEFTEMLREAVNDLRHFPEWRQLSTSIWPQLLAGSVDRFTFRKTTAEPAGLISWRVGEELIVSARLALAAGVKAFLGGEQYFGNRHGSFANRFLDQLMMGQTAEGSYIVSAFARPDGLVTVKGSGLDTIALRDLSLQVIDSVESTKEAIEHFRSSASMSGFLERVDRGVSYEMTSALSTIVSNSDEAGIALSLDLAEGDTMVPDVRAVKFQAPDADVLTRAATIMATYPTVPAQTFSGRVHLLTRQEAGGPGVIGIDSSDSHGPRKVRVRLDASEDYHRAVQAHDAERDVTVRGELVREGNLHWLYSARLVSVSEVSSQEVVHDLEASGFEGLWQDDGPP